MSKIACSPTFHDQNISTNFINFLTTTNWYSTTKFPRDQGSNPSCCLVSCSLPFSHLQRLPDLKKQEVQFTASTVSIDAQSSNNSQVTAIVALFIKFRSLVPRVEPDVNNENLVVRIGVGLNGGHRDDDRTLTGAEGSALNIVAFNEL